MATPRFNQTSPFLQALPTGRFNNHITIKTDNLNPNDGMTDIQYTSAVTQLLNTINSSKTGQAVIRQLALGSKNLTIYPYTLADVNNSTYNAFAQATDYQAATIAGQYERSGKDGTQLKDGNGQLIAGTGTGSDSYIHFSPTTWFLYRYNNAGHISGAQSDEILLHEMVHAMRQMAGKFDPGPLGYMFDTEEEFFAVVVADVYASELKRTGDVRADHHGFDPMASTQDTSAKFLPKVDLTDYKYRLIDKMARQEPQLCRDLATVVADFNPFKRYYDLQKFSLAIGLPFVKPPLLNLLQPTNTSNTAPQFTLGNSRPAGPVLYKPMAASLRFK